MLPFENALLRKSSVVVPNQALQKQLTRRRARNLKAKQKCPIDLQTSETFLLKYQFMIWKNIVFKARFPFDCSVPKREYTGQ